ncbi:heparinase II/III-like protein [Sinobacterium caligoides]|uniref:Heparinase II/III-like protein n=2 Tax=Sinobacterium caligoides TaxID=933926 RepID=A0A3N2DZ53_9GAMM|nr:heparinase II/III-like protein [Sinobacterium caligoides]
MGFREVAHRLFEQIKLLLLRLEQGGRDKGVLRYDVTDYAFCRRVEPKLSDLLFELPSNEEWKEAILSASWPALGYQWCWREQGDWHLAPDTEKYWPKDFFGDISYRAGNPFGDVRVAWEPSRLQQLVALGLLAGDKNYRERAVILFERLLLSWLEANPPYRGIHYISAMECALRLISVCHAVDLMRPYLRQPVAIWQGVVSLVDSHASLIVHRLSLHSSAGNHTIAECAGLIYAGVLFPELAGAARWLKTGKELLEQEAQRQFLEDGGGVEQAFGYHLFITDLCNLSARLLAAHDLSSPRLEGIVDSACDFLAEFFSEEWLLPSIGDSDDGYALSPYLRISHRRADKFLRVKTFTESGYSLLRDKDVASRSIIFDHGCLGMPPSYGHGHSDCLSVTWREQGEMLLIDPGTFTYTGDERWRRYFRGATAHNTVSVNRLDQAMQQSAFMWSEPFEARKIEVSEAFAGYTVLLACHSGYQALGVVHYRALIYSEAGVLSVWDRLLHDPLNNDKRELSLWWHVSGEVSANAGDNQFSLLGRLGTQLQLRFSGGKLVTHVANEEQGLGWDAPQYGVKRPITTIEVCHSGNTTHEFLSHIGSDLRQMNPEQEQVVEQIIIKLRLLTG